jgi:hypothetical protein
MEDKLAGAVALAAAGDQVAFTEISRSVSCNHA